MSQHEPELNLALPEDVLIETILNPKAMDGWDVYRRKVLTDFPDTWGLASYFNETQKLLHYLIKDMLRPNFEPQAGFFVVIQVQADISRSINWFDEDDIEPIYQSLRPATDDEIALFKI